MILITLLALFAAQEADPPEFGAGQCDAKPVQHLKGRPATKARLGFIQRKSKTKIVRVAKPNMTVTMDYRTDRITVSVNGKNQILRLSCG